jgi:hypothetical protein
LIERLLNNEKILTLLYDKTFYPDLKHVDLAQSDDGADLDQNGQYDVEKMED